MAACSTRKRSVLGVLLQAIDKMDEHSAGAHSAALAYYSLFSIAPVLIVVITIAGAVLGKDAVRGQIVYQFEGIMGHDAALAVQSLLQRASTPGSGKWMANVIGIVTLLIGTTAVFVQLQDSLNQIWEVKPKPGNLLGTLLWKRFVSFSLVLAIGFLLLISLALSAMVAAATGYLNSRLPLPGPVLETLNVTLGFFLLAILVALIYRILPDAKIEWADVALGAVVTSVLFLVGKSIIGIYLGRAAVSSPYGAAGSLVAILLWVFYASWILLFGAEITRAYTCLYRTSKVEPEQGAMKVKPVPPT